MNIILVKHNSGGTHRNEHEHAARVDEAVRTRRLRAHEPLGAPVGSPSLEAPLGAQENLRSLEGDPTEHGAVG